ncbi:proline dehydrogenase 1, mitochondrial-like [Phalaenopsis equestris]|uniref:proline dehydrogenase 1, mitochondrial-like n=1 Tax=Phalaenopsis equestris TaxID=78828 RepID=UPI0009E4CA9A|nr:proline dehydrogenase 1, mitochondrial-like [Phalaenopsis equestris]
MAFVRKITNALRSLFKNRPSPPLFLGQNRNSPPELDPHDPCRLYRNMKTGEVLRSLAVLFPATVGPVVDLGAAMMRSRAVEKNLVARMAVMGAVKQTVYRQLRTGENAGEAAESLRLLWKRGMNGILDYGLEGGVYVAAAGDTNFAGFVSSADGMENLRSSRRILETYPQSTPAAPATLNRGGGEEEERELHLSLERLTALGNRCSPVDLPLLGKAELYAAAVGARNNDRPIVDGTIQALLRGVGEERGLLSSSVADRELLSHELKRRLGVNVFEELLQES